MRLFPTVAMVSGASVFAVLAVVTYRDYARAERQAAIVQSLLAQCLEIDARRYGHGSPEHKACARTATHWFDKPAASGPEGTIAATE